jgi:anaerobic ribonucleoside-triphosphate reductase activating protein
MDKIEKPVISINKIESNSLVDGPGRRAVLFMQGCLIHCPSCQSRHTWNIDKGFIAPVGDISQVLISLSISSNNVTISGGEPFFQVEALAWLVRDLANAGRHILIYTGYTWEMLNNGMNGHTLMVREILERTNTLVDGPYKKAQDDNFLIYRGSRNQRPINVQASLKAGKVVTEDWDNPEITIDETGDLSIPLGLTGLLADMGTVKASRMCGQSRG